MNGLFCTTRGYPKMVCRPLHLGPCVVVLSMSTDGWSPHATYPLLTIQPKIALVPRVSFPVERSWDNALRRSRAFNARTQLSRSKCVRRGQSGYLTMLASPFVSHSHCTIMRKHPNSDLKSLAMFVLTARFDSFLCSALRHSRFVIWDEAPLSRQC